MAEFRIIDIKIKVETVILKHVLIYKETKSRVAFKNTLGKN